MNQYSHISTSLAENVLQLAAAFNHLENSEHVAAVSELQNVSRLISWALVETQRTAGTYQPTNLEQTIWAGICSAWASSVGSPFQSPTVADYQYFDGFARGLLVLAIIFHSVPHDLVDDIEYLITLAAFITSEANGSGVKL